MRGENSKEDKYKEGVDFEWVNSNARTKDGGYVKTRKFFSRAEREARKNPKEEPKVETKSAPKKAAKKEPKGLKSSLRPKTRPKAKVSYTSSEIPSVDVMGNATGFARGGAVRGQRKAKLC